MATTGLGLSRLIDEIKTAAFRAVAPDGRCPLCQTDLSAHTPVTAPAAARPRSQAQVSGEPLRPQREADRFIDPPRAHV